MNFVSGGVIFLSNFQRIQVVEPNITIPLRTGPDPLVEFPLLVPLSSAPGLSPLVDERQGVCADPWPVGAGVAGREPSTSTKHA